MIVILWIAGVVLGPLINHCIYTIAYFSKPISPWQVRPDSIGPLSAAAKLPIVGWLMRWKDALHFGKWFWLRPMLIECATPFVIVWLYRYVQSGACIPADVPTLATMKWELDVQFVSYAILILFMAVATFIDFDERTIPDWITVPGTIVGLFGSALVSGWGLWSTSPPVFPANGGAPIFGGPVTIHANSPYEWPFAWQQGVPGSSGLWLGISLWVLWCFALTDRRWIMRRGIRKAFEYFWVGILRTYNLRVLIVLGILGSILILFAYTTLPPQRWQSLLSSLIGMGLGGLLVWGFRIVSGWVMQQEAMGFGDVTLMAMVGAFFGWQIVWVAFFAAPFFAIVFVIVAWLITRDPATPFGPYLCAATVFLMLNWVTIWDLFSIWIMPANVMLVFLIGLLVALGTMLFGIRGLKLWLYDMLSPPEKQS